MNEVAASALDEAVDRFAPLWEAAYDKGVSRRFTAPGKTIKECILRNLEGHESDTFIRFGEESITRGRADELSCRLANALGDVGVVPGDCVSIIVSNRPEIVYSFTACYKAGFVAAAYNQRSTACEIYAAVQSAESTAVIIERDQLDKVLGFYLNGDFDTVRALVVVDGGEGYSASVDGATEEALAGRTIVSFEDLIARGSSDEPAYEVKPDDFAVQLFTGGTTGKSKGLRQTQGALAFEIQDMGAWTGSALHGRLADILVCMPMTHVMGINYGIHWQLINGGSVIITSRTKSDEIVADVDRYKPTVWATLPALLLAVSHEEGVADTAFRDLDLIIFGGSFMPKETLVSFKNVTQAPFVNSYGMSESFGFVSCNPVGSVRDEGKVGKIASIGVPIAETDMLIVDLDDGTEPMDPGHCGEIVFRGPQCAKEYWKNPAETAHAIRNGWVYSGDIGYMDEDGYFFIVDRKKDMISVGGFNVFPSEIDNVLSTHPAVKEVCTIGVPDERSGERAKAFVSLKAGCESSEEELRAYCKHFLVAYKAPKYIEFIDEIPKTKAHKPNRAALKRLEESRS